MSAGERVRDRLVQRHAGESAPGHSAAVTRRMLVLGLVVAVWGGCGAASGDPMQGQVPPAPSAARGEPLSNKVDVADRRKRLVADAEEALARSWPLDYHRPFARYDDDRTDVATLFVEACRAGDHPSCWIAATLAGAPVAIVRDARALVYENCAAGDLMSCRALYDGHGKKQEYPNAPGAAGRSASCQDPAYFRPEGVAPCDIAGLRRECALGFQESCRLLDWQALDELPDHDTFKARTLNLVREGCQARIDQECELQAVLARTERRVTAERMCPIARDACLTLAWNYHQAGELLRERDLRERLCQYGGVEIQCFRLGEAYVKGELTEPLPGRGAALITWACAQPGMTAMESATCAPPTKP